MISSTRTGSSKYEEVGQRWKSRISAEKYYLWYLKQKGVEGITGKINYQSSERPWTCFGAGDDEKIHAIVNDIKVLVEAELPPPIQRMKMCKNCSYRDILGVIKNNLSRLSRSNYLNRYSFRLTVETTFLKLKLLEQLKLL
ncbi:MAG: Dna2/Cas4 domain-containing protein [Planctomycetia bacterium]|nr:Dna2/Cas4 domain-containing protein [Planctomycetia bacterium]